MMTEEDRKFMDTEVVVAGSHPAKHNVFEVSELAIAEGVPGVWVEAGACGGGQIAVMERALQKHGQVRMIHAFDSWEGIPKATPEDDEPQKGEYGVRQPGEAIVSSGKLICGVENFWGNMRKWGARCENIVAHQGWLQETLVGWNAPIGLLRIDVDLTDSVRVCAKYLYPFLVKGGYCIFDDWYTEWRPQRQAMIDAVGEWLPGAVIPVEGNPGTVWWQKL